MFRISSVHPQEHFVEAVFADLVCGTTVRTIRHVQPLRSDGWTWRIVRTVVPHTKSANTACKTLLRMDRCGPKRVELTYVMNKNSVIKTLCVSFWTAYILRWCYFAHTDVNFHIDWVDIRYYVCTCIRVISMTFWARGCNCPGSQGRIIAHTFSLFLENVLTYTIMQFKKLFVVSGNELSCKVAQ